MTRREALLALADRCEREEPSRELDEAIYLAIDPIQNNWPRPNFTTSRDAAVSLVPAGAWRETNGPRRSLHLPTPSPNFWKTEVDLWRPSFSMHMGWAATEAMSIDAAALRAIASLEEQT